MNISFAEYTPSQALIPYIQSYWVGDFNITRDQKFNQSVVPNGCIELIIHLTDDHCALTKNDKNWSESPIFTLIGLYKKPYEVKFSQYVKVFGIRFYPDGMRNIFGIPPSEFISTYENGSDVLGKRLRTFCSRIRDLNDPAQQVELADAFINKQLSHNKNAYDYTHATMQLIRKMNGIADFQGLTSQIPISLRQLQREFKVQYGISIKDYMRLLRLNTIHNYMLSQNQSLTQLSYDLQFTDQSHFIREFKQYVGLPPKKFSKYRDQFIINPLADTHPQA